MRPPLLLPPTARPAAPRRLAAQRGTSIINLLVVALIVGFFVLMAIRVYPSVSEYLVIKRAVAQIMKGSPGSASDIRTAFDKQTEVEYNIKTIGGKDLQITQNGDRFTTSFDYAVEIPVVEPVYLLIKYSGSASSKAGGP